MKDKKFLIYLFLVVLFLLSYNSYSQIIAKDSLGLSIQIKEKYGGIFYDTGTVISIVNECIFITKKNEYSSIFPLCNYSIVSIYKL
ncbi:MAG: hypothetical protein EHM12_11275 [Dehalococcoidia bacterium]|nr:MAG: hypothetical protein EHM12_11275 [Dehalococcoidia bacterium]